MISDEQGLYLHDRATRGLELSDQESSYLAEWYAVQDATESTMLQLQHIATSQSDLSEQIAIIMQQLTVVTQTIQSLAQENATLRGEIATLQQHVTLSLTPQPT